MRPILTVSEPTVEGLVKLLADSHPTIGLFSSEGGSFLGGHAMADDAKLRSAARLSALWDGEPIDRIRSVGDASVLVGRRVALHLMAQPEAAMKFLADTTLRDQGLLSRILIGAPDPSSRRLFREPNPASRQRIDEFAGRTRALMERLDNNQPQEANLPCLVLDSEARQLFVRWHDEVERALSDRFGSVRGFAAKLPEHAVRIAAVISAFADITDGVISGEPMSSGIRLADFYAGEAIRLAETASISAPLAKADRLRQWLQVRSSDLIHLAEIYQRGPGDVRDKASALASLKTLEDHGWVERVDGGLELDGCHRRDVWRIVET